MLAAPTSMLARRLATHTIGGVAVGGIAGIGTRALCINMRKVEGSPEVIPTPTFVPACSQSSYFNLNTSFQHFPKKSIFYKVPRPGPHTKNDRKWIP